MKKLAVVALGGNALLRGDQKGTIDEQELNAYETSEKLMLLIKDKQYNLVVTHGNGPQVGNLLLNNDAGHKMYGLPEMPLDIFAWLIRRVLLVTLSSSSYEMC